MSALQAFLRTFPAPRRFTEFTTMTTVPAEINAAAIKASPTEKVTPMMQQY